MERFSWPCDPSRIEETIEYDTLITQVPGYEQRRAKREAGRRRWRLRFRKDQVDADAIEQFVIDRRGAFEAFEWTNPVDGKTYIVRFAEDVLSQSARWRVQYEFTLELVEVM